MVSVCSALTMFVCSALTVSVCSALIVSVCSLRLEAVSMVCWCGIEGQLLVHSYGADLALMMFSSGCSVSEE